MRMSSVNSGWKLVPTTFPCLTATTSPASSFAFSSPDLVLRGMVASTSAAFSGVGTPPVVSPELCASLLLPLLLLSSVSTIGALMNTPGKVCGAPESPVDSRNGNSTSNMKLCACRPKWLRWTRTSRPPMSSWPPFLVAVASSESRTSPAQVPQVGRRSILCFRVSALRSDPSRLWHDQGIRT